MTSEFETTKPDLHKKFRPLILSAFFLFIAILCFVPLNNNRKGGSTKDYPLWFKTGTLMLHNQTPYYLDQHNEFPFMYPPGAAALLALIAPLGKAGMMSVLVTLNSLAWFVCIAGSVWLVTGSARRAHPLMYAVPWLVTIAFVWSTYLEGQVAMFLSALLIAMLVFLRKKIAWAAGAMLALAAAIKGFPICAICYLIWRRQWMATFWTVIFLACLTLIMPMFFRGVHGAMDDLRVWNKGVGSSYTPDIIGQRKERSYTWQNQSLLAVTNRWLRPVIADRDDKSKPVIYVNIANLDFKTINYIITAIAGVLCLTYVAVMPRYANRTRMTDALEGGMLLILVIIFSPLSFTYNNSWLMLPVAAIVYFILNTKSQTQKVIAITWLIAALVLLIAGSQIEIFRQPRDRGSIFFADVLLFFELAWLSMIEKGNRRGAEHAEADA